MSVAVIIASCNREERAFSTAEKLLGCGYHDVIIVDDGSNPPYQTKHSGCKLLHLRSNKGPSSARNFGALNTNAEWLIFLDDDDNLEPKLINWLNENITCKIKNYDLIHFGYRKVDQLNKKILTTNLSTKENSSMLTGSWMMKRDFFFSINGYEEELKYSENTDLIERAKNNNARTMHAGFITLNYLVGRPQRKNEMAERRAQACIFYIKHRPHCDRKKMLKIGLINSWWCKSPFLSFVLLFTYIKN